MLLIHPVTGTIIDANIAACDYYQYSKKQLLDLTILEINILSATEVSKEMEKAKNESRNYFNFKHKLSTGKVRDVEVYSSPIVINNEKILFSIIHDITDKLQLAKEREEVIFKLQKAHKEIKKLEGIIPICMHCKEIRDDKGSWNQLEKYIGEHSEAQFSHSICDKCLKEHYPEEDD